MTFTKIVTHPGSAHKDEFLACSVLISRYHLPVERRDPLPEELVNPEVFVVDVGSEHAPEKSNFDHHQFPRDYPPTCALSLVMKHLNVYQSANRYYDWFKTAEWFDSKGPEQTAHWLGVPRETLPKLNSPIESIVLNLFSRSRKIEKDSMVWNLMKEIGNQILGYIRILEKRLKVLQQISEVWSLDSSDRKEKIEVLFLPIDDQIMDDPTLGVDKFIEAQGKSDSMHGMIYPDKRGSGYALRRYRDNQRLDFCKVAEDEDVFFAHTQGFIAKTSARESTKLKQLVVNSFKSL